MKRVVILAILFCALGGYICPEPTTSDVDKAFASGMAAGFQSMNESDVMQSWIGLVKLDKVDGVASYKQLLIARMNTALFSMSFVDRDVPIRPESLKILARISSPNSKGAFRKISEERIKNGWQSDDPEKEKKIQWSLDRLIKYGNIYGFED